MIFKNNQIDGELRAQNDVYTVRDNLSMDKLILSQTILHAGKETRGHHHAGQEEVYFFIFGSGIMILGQQSGTKILGQQEIPVVAGDIVVIPDGVFHRVINTGETDLVFNTVYNRLEQSTTVYAKGAYE